MTFTLHNVKFKCIPVLFISEFSYIEAWSPIVENLYK